VPGDLQRELNSGVLVLTFNRPERNNAWTWDLEDEFFDALVDAAADPDVRVVVVTGSQAGKAFCPGLDMEVLRDASEGRRDRRARRPMTLARLIPKPVIAAVNGACAGIGFIQACSADIRFAARGAKLTTSFVRRGLPAENSISWLLPRLVGTGKAMDLLLSGRVVLAEEAFEIGLVDRLCEPDQLMPEVVAYATEMATMCSPSSMATIKQQVLDDWTRTSEESRARSLQLIGELRATGDLAEGVRSYQEKRPPRFEGVSVVVDVPTQPAP
jgi:enoyl-CoA hydratase/carnithine racemase